MTMQETTEGVMPQEQTASQPILGERHQHEERVWVNTRYVGQHLRVTLRRQIDGPIPGTSDAEYITHADQAELVIEAGTRVTIGRSGIVIEPIG